MTEIASLLHTLRDGDDLTARYNAAVQIGYSGDDRAADMLTMLMRHADDWGIRQNAAWAAGQLRVKACLPALHHLLMHDDDEQVCYVAALAIVRIDAAQLGAVVGSTDALRRIIGAAQRAAPYLVEQNRG
ncbi:MAG: HEAT repeat domain-containing protein [Chloroflexota bacterium]